MSYLPVSEPVGRRRRRLRDTFGFSCACERCRLETAWAREDGDPTGDETNVAGSNPGVGADGFLTAEGEAAVEARAAAAEEAMEEEEDRRAASLDDAERERRADRMPPGYRHVVREKHVSGGGVRWNPRAAEHDRGLHDV